MALLSDKFRLLVLKLALMTKKNDEFRIRNFNFWMLMRPSISSSYIDILATRQKIGPDLFDYKAARNSFQT